MLVDDAHGAYEAREEELGSEVMRELERRVVLQVLDRKWREHLYEMDYLQEGIGLRAMAQRDPLVEYQREGFDMFNGMLDAIKEESVGFLFNVEVEVQQPAPEEPAVDAEQMAALAPAPAVDRSAPALTAKGLQTGGRSDNLQYSAPTLDATEPEMAATGGAAVSSGEPGRTRRARAARARSTSGVTERLPRLATGSHLRPDRPGPGRRCVSGSPHLEGYRAPAAVEALEPRGRGRVDRAAQYDGGNLGHAVGRLADPHGLDQWHRPQAGSSTGRRRSSGRSGTDGLARPVLELGRGPGTGQRLEHRLKEPGRPRLGLGQVDREWSAADRRSRSRARTGAAPAPRTAAPRAAGSG